ncbi:hypothetical protein RCH33_467 [Flavobacterium daejeonense]|nr:hypothetical protein RCH33_467 [Flavobacterium daejeonense]
MEITTMVTEIKNTNYFPLKIKRSALGVSFFKPKKAKIKLIKYFWHSTWIKPNTSKNKKIKSPQNNF